MLDFGLARKFVDENGVMRKRREAKIGFRGTPFYAPLVAHEKRDTAPKDDCESWFYLLLDLISPKGLPWEELKEMDDIFECKKRCRQEKAKTMLDGLPNTTELYKIIEYIDSRKFEDKVDYKFIFD
ncbi:unnamed protein product [Caenorhabditis angaria]|uniref:Protein kinase domain-containing protein n=1 Tax=Caenorhabditis angaria TaxID=860376 RepID=A0A9P1MX39_9PELO|nr:unnamed protein product [Caenorhabditis angaria]